MQCPINVEIFLRASRGELAADERARLLLHLQTPCADCDAFFETEDLDLDTLLLALYPAGPEKGNGTPALSEEAKARVYGQVKAGLGEGEVAAKAARTNAARIKIAPGRALPRRFLALAAGVVLALLIPAAVWRAGLWPDRATVKGSGLAGEGPVFLQFLVLKRAEVNATEPTIIRGVNQAVYEDRDQLLFRYRIDSPGHVFIVRVGPDAAAEFIFPGPDEKSELHQPGVYDAHADNRVLIYRLEGLDGLQNFCAAATASPAESSRDIMSRISQTIIQNRAHLMPSRVRNDGMDCFQIKVEKEWNNEQLEESFQP